MSISVLIPTLNEARNLADCLASVAWCNDIVVVDSNSTDGTQQIARQAGARMVDFRWNGTLPKKKNWALQNIEWKNEWVLVLDADERVVPALAQEMCDVTARPKADGYFINRRFIFLGQWIRHCGYYPSWNLRLFRHGKGRYEAIDTGDIGAGDNEVHEHVILAGATGRLRHDLLHLAYPDIFTWVEKHNRYSNWEARVEVERLGDTNRHAEIGAQQRTARQLRRWSRALPMRPTLRFLYSYVLRRGFLDGRAGLIFCRLLASYEMLSLFKAHELRRHPASALRLAPLLEPATAQK